MRAALANDIRNLVEQRGCHGCSVLCLLIIRIRLAVLVRLRRVCRMVCSDTVARDRRQSANTGRLPHGSKSEEEKEKLRYEFIGMLMVDWLRFPCSLRQTDTGAA
jgi:hypothetical protein